MIAIRPMTAADIPIGIELVAQVGWNQVPRDWQRFLVMQPDGCFVAEVNDRGVGTTVTCIFGDIAWLAMVLVDQTQRGRGIGTALVKHALAFLDARQVRTVRLDATALGRSIYEKYGFAEQYSLVRFSGTLPQMHAQENSDVRTIQPLDVPRCLTLDREITNTHRDQFLRQLFAEHPQGFHGIEENDRLLGWMTVRFGRDAWQLGPCVAAEQAGIPLLNDAARQLAGQSVYYDVPSANSAAVNWAEAQGLRPVREFVRMCRGEPICEDVRRLWASSGPELG